MSSGPEGTFFYNIAVVVIFCLVFSLIESKLILPAHLAHMKFNPIKKDSWRAKFNDCYFGLINGPYKRLLAFCTEWRWAVFFGFIAVLLISAGLVQANYVRFVPNPKVPHDFPQIRIEMNETVSDERTIEALKQIESVVWEIEAQTKEANAGQGMIRDLLAWNNGRTEASILVPLVDEELRPYDTFELARRWRGAIPEIPGMKSFSIQDDVNGGGDDGEFGYLLFGPDIDTLKCRGQALYRDAAATGRPV